MAHLTNDPGLKDVFQSSNKTADIFIQLTAQWSENLYLIMLIEWTLQSKIFCHVKKERARERERVSVCVCVFVGVT